MRLRAMMWASCFVATLAVCAVPGAAASIHECVAGKVTAESYTWDFKGEANATFKDIQYDARQALDHADILQSFTEDTNLNRETHAEQLEHVKEAINSIGAKICRLETIRRVLAPWQQKVVDEIAKSTQAMVSNTTAAIVFVNEKPNQLWPATYRQNVTNLYNEANSLTHTVGDAAQFAGVSKEYRDLGRKLGVRASS